MAALRWYLVVQLLGWMAFLLIASSTRVLADRGLALSKTLGVLICGFALWIGTAAGVVRNEPGGVLIALLAMAGVVATRSPRRWRDLLPDRRLLVTTELLFAAAFASWCVVKSMYPAVAHTEQPMDLMLLTAAFESASFPPQDPWLAGYPIAYYYVGYWLMSAVALLSGVAPSVAYNIGQACWFALLVVGCFGIGVNLASSRTIGERGLSWTTIGAGVLTAAVVTWTSNLQLLLDAVRGRWTPAQFFTGTWWWWPSSRVLQDRNLAGGPIEVITEFPFFSYLLGDNHPHLLAMPVVVLTIGLAFYVFVSVAERRAWKADPPALLALAAGAALIPINTWDFPASAALLLLAAILPLWPTATAFARFGLVSAALAMLLAGVIAATAPFALTAQSQVRGVLPNLFHPTAISQLATMFGTLVPGVALLFVVAHRAAPLRGRCLARTAFAGVLGCVACLLAGALWAAMTTEGNAWLARVAPGVDRPLWIAVERWSRGWPAIAALIAGVAVGVSLLRARRRAAAHDPALTYAVLLATIGLGLVLVPELIYAHDVFENRMNTVFKFYYQAWLFLGLSAAFGIARAWRPGGALRAAGALAVIMLCAGMIYPPLAIWERTGGLRHAFATLDALDHLRREQPETMTAIEWIKGNTQRNQVVVEAAGDSYRADHNRISMATARPTLLGWQGHEQQWRGQSFDAMTAGRLDALARIYQPRSDDDLQRTLHEWNVSLVVIGGFERARYSISADEEARIGRVMELAFERGSVRIYRRRG